jgi:hypothetical protein
MVKIKTFIEAYGEPFIILVQLIHLMLKLTEGPLLVTETKLKDLNKT